MNGLGDALGGTLLALVLGVPLVIAGFYALDAITPGNLAKLIMGTDGTPDNDVDADGASYTVYGDDYREPSMNAAILAAANVIGTSLIVFTAIWTNFNGGTYGATIAWTLTFGVIGIAAQVGAVKLVDVATPGHLTDTVCARPNVHPAAVFAAAANLAMALIVVAAIA